MNTPTAAHGALPEAGEREASFYDLALLYGATAEVTHSRSHGDDLTGLSFTRTAFASFCATLSSSDPLAEICVGPLPSSEEECVAQMAKISAANKVKRLSRAALSPASPAPAVPSGWNALTDEDRDRAFKSMPDMLEGFMKTWGWLHFAKAIEAICEEKNAATPAWEPEFDATSHEQEKLAIDFCAEIAGPLCKRGRLPDPVRLLEMAEALYQAERRAALKEAPGGGQ